MIRIVREILMEKMFSRGLMFMMLILRMDLDFVEL